MSVIWLIVWLFKDTPNIEMFGPWDSWGIALAICIVLDVLGVFKSQS